MRKVFFISIFIFCFSAHAYSPGRFYFDPHLAVGTNLAQGTHFIAGVDLGYAIDERWAAGVGVYYSAGEQPKHDREMGAGPFVSYFYPFTSFFIAQFRQELNYVDLNDPIKTITPNGTVYSHENYTGMASHTTAGVHLLFMNFGVSVGYRLVLGLTNSHLDDGRSGPYLGFSIGI